MSWLSRNPTGGRPQAEHLVKLHARQQADIELLDELRDFVKARMKLEIEFAQSLQKLAQSHLAKRKGPEQPPVDSQQDIRLLEEAEHSAQSQLEAMEHLGRTVVEPIRPQVKAKTHHLRRCDELHTKYQANIAGKQKQLQQIQKHYNEAQKSAETNKAKLEKDKDAAEGGKKSFKTLTKTKTELQQKARRASERWEQSMVDATSARNMYLLSLMAYNSQLGHYHSTDLPDYVKVMDANYHERMRMYLTSYATLHREHAEREITSMSTLLGCADQISQAAEQRQLLSDTAFVSEGHMDFVAYGADTETELDTDALQVEALQKELQRMVNVRARARRTIATMQKNMDKANDMVKMFGQQPEDSEQRQEFENQTMDWRYELVAAQWEDLRCTVRIESLAAQGLDIPEEEAVADEPVGGATEVHSMHSWEHTNTSLDDLGSTMQCVALYDYEASAEDELSIRTGEAVTIVGDEVDGWVKVTNQRGQQGLVPASYLGSPPSAQPAAATTRQPIAVAVALYSNEEADMLAFDEGDEIEVLEYDRHGDGYWFGRTHGNGQEGHFLAELVQLR